MIEKGDAVEIRGKFKTVVDFLSKADKETLRILASFFQGEAKGTIDAKKFNRKMLVSNLYKGAVEVELGKNFVWEEKEVYFRKCTNDS